MQGSLNAYIKHPRSTWKEVRDRLQYLLDAETASDLRDNAQLRQRAFVNLRDAQLHLPLEVGDYTDFYASREHAYSCGVIIRGKDNALQPNWSVLAGSAVIKLLLTYSLIVSAGLIFQSATMAAHQQ